ncbi:lipoprotein [Carnobacterium sp. 17-4]|uniref:lipoprotein n=1 Tax=Carnobacterium sp. (strain 17-4) TaxID=208596 RepID=UPI0002FD22A6|nr:lipoprotein [Carnobacterium sp. 17-4]
MRKILTLLGAVVLLAGCDFIGGGSESTSSSETSSAVTSESMMSSEMSSESSAVASSQSSSIATEESMVDSSATGETATDMVIPLVPQKMELDQGLTLESDSVLQEIEMRMAESEDIGIENDVAIHFTGMYLGETGEMQAIFIIVNRMEVAMTNIEITISFSTVDGDVILDKAAFHLTEESFGVLEPDTAMPIYLNIPPENEEAFFSTSDINNLVYTIDEFDFEER